MFHNFNVMVLFCIFYSTVISADDFKSYPLRPNRQVEELTLPNIFSDHMVLQQGKDIRVWGWAKPNTEVSVSFAEDTVKTKSDDNGNWQLLLKPLMKSFQPRKLTVSTHNKSITINDVLVGEVWLCGGQSNMEWTLRGSIDSDIEIQSANFPAIRFIRLPKNANSFPQSDFKLEDSKGAWRACTSENVQDCTAVGYYFGKRLRRFLNVPVGLIDTSWGGTMAQHWVEHSRLLGIEEMKPYLDNFLPG